MIYLDDFIKSPKLTEEEYKTQEEDLQERLYILFNEVYNQKRSVLIVLEGWAESGKGEILQAIAKRLDPRKMHFYSFVQEDYENDSYPFLWKYWYKLPVYGHSILLDGSWYSGVSYRKRKQFINDAQYEASFRAIKSFETQLVQDRYIFMKFFLNLSEKEQTKRLDKAIQSGKMWKVSEADWEQNKNYKKYKKLFEKYLNETNFPDTPWYIVPAKEKHYSKLNILVSIIEYLEKKLNVNSKEILRVMKANEGKA